MRRELINQSILDRRRGGIPVLSAIATDMYSEQSPSSVKVKNGKLKDFEENPSLWLEGNNAVHLRGTWGYEYDIMYVMVSCDGKGMDLVTLR